ncbi:MAG: BlaR1 family beta-lactam sensor/signal transducer [Clostridium sp.]|nr:BlaR1 family beta-lactam sensor/signal transducer [Clostridium sp.]
MMVSLMVRLWTCSAVILFMVILIIAIKTLLKRRLSPRALYRLWFPLLLIPAEPFLPLRLGSRSGALPWPAPLQAAEHMISRELTGSAQDAAAGWLRDFSVSVSGRAPAWFYRIAFSVWIAGVVLMAAAALRSLLGVRRLKRASLPLQNREVRALYDSCRRELGIRRDIPVLSTAYLKTPVTAGVLRPCILLPIEAVGGLSADELRFILLHELLHCRHRDTLVNQLACIVRIVYWFHPAVRIAVNQLRSDGEAACDAAVLSCLEEQDRIPYGSTLIRFAAGISGINRTPAAGLGGSARELRKRILGIKSYRPETRRDKVRGAAAFVLVAALACCAVPPVTASAEAKDYYHFTAANETEVDLSACFEGYEGSFVLYDTAADRYYIHNPKAARTRVSPDSTYKPYSALAALQAGVIAPDCTDRAWDGAMNPFESWNQDHTLSSAMKNSVNWYFNSLDQSCGLETLQRSFSALHFGNEDLSGGIGKYWVESTLKISPVEQVELMTRLEAETLPFDPGQLRAVKDALFLSESGGLSLWGKTGTGTVEHRDVNGWFVGYARSAENTWVFAVNILGKDGANGAAAGRIALRILEGLPGLNSELQDPPAAHCLQEKAAGA